MVTLSILHIVSCANSIFDAVFWEVKPYTFINEKGHADGIYPMIFKQAEIYCKNSTVWKKYNADRLISFNRFNMSSRRNFLNTFKADYKKMPSMKPGRDVWFPIFYKNSEEMRKVEQEKQLMNFDISQSKELAIIVRRDYISLPFKIFRGIFSCGQIIFISILLTVFFGILLWLVEGKYNPAFPENSLRGAGTGMWWSLVSMTTVGYGDVVPKTILGRLIAIIWMFIGVMIACVITATVTEVVNGISDLKIDGQKVAVLENSFEAEKIKDFRAVTVEKATYADVYEAVRSGEVFAAAINVDIASWNIDEIQDDTKPHPLRIVKKIPVNLNINIVLSSRIRYMPDIKKIIRCMGIHKAEVYYRPVTHFSLYCPTETIYMGSFLELFRTVVVQALLAGIGLVLMLGIIKNLDMVEHGRYILKKCGFTGKETKMETDVEKFHYHLEASDLKNLVRL